MSDWTNSKINAALLEPMSFDGLMELSQKLLQRSGEWKKNGDVLQYNFDVVMKEIDKRVMELKG